VDEFQGGPLGFDVTGLDVGVQVGLGDADDAATEADPTVRENLGGTELTVLSAKK
jgi:hypothetical protein